MGTIKPPVYIHASPKCIAASLREMADLMESGSREIFEAGVSYATADNGEHLTVYRVIHAPGRSEN